MSGISTRTESNRRNSTLSTGPRTAEGKARSRRNSLKHGLAGAGTVLPDSDAEAVAAQQEALGAIAEVRPLLARRVAVLAQRLDNLARYDQAATSRRLREANAGVDVARHEAVDALMANLPADPVAASRRLRSTPEGCERLILAWDDLRRCLALTKKWGEPQTSRAQALSGHDPSALAPSTWQILAVTRGGCLFYEPPCPTDPKNLDPARIAAAKQKAEGQLEAAIEAEIADLCDLHQTLSGSDDPDVARDEAEALALFDVSPQATLLRRYEMATERGLYRALRELETPLLPDPSKNAQAIPIAEPVQDENQTVTTREVASSLASFGTVAASGVEPPVLKPNFFFLPSLPDAVPVLAPNPADGFGIPETSRLN